MGKLQNFAINLDKPMFRAGEMVTGNVHVILSQPMKAREMRLIFRGKANVHWTERRSSGSGKNRRTHTVHYSADETFYDYKVSLWQRDGQDEKIPAGNHVYPFSFELRPNSPASFEGQHGYLRYWLKATIDKPWKFDHDVKAAFTVICHMDLNTIARSRDPILQQKEAEIGCCNCFSNPGKYHASLRADYHGHVPGEQIHSTVEIHNNSERPIQGSVLLKMYTHFHATRKTRSINSCISSTDTRSVAPGGHAVWDDYLDIPPVPPTNLGGCSIIGVEYYLKAKLSADDFCSTGSIKLGDEIIIGTVPLNLPRYLPVAFPPSTTPSCPPMAGYGALPPQPYAGFTSQPVTSGPGTSIAAASAPSPPSFGRQLSTDIPPPSYEECMFMGKTSIKDDDDTEHTRGDLSYAPRYAFYNLRTQPGSNPSSAPQGFTSEPEQPNIPRI